MCNNVLLCALLGTDSRTWYFRVCFCVKVEDRYFPNDHNFFQVTWTRETICDQLQPTTNPVVAAPIETVCIYETGESEDACFRIDTPRRQNRAKNSTNVTQICVVTRLPPALLPIRSPARVIRS